MGNRTTKPEYGPFILEALRKLGEAQLDELLDEVHLLMEDRLHPDDLVILSNGEPRWRNQAQHMLDGMVDDGYVTESNGLLSVSDP